MRRIVSIITLLAVTSLSVAGEKSIEEKTRIHRLSTNKRAVYDAFAYVNRIPDKVEEGESAEDLAGRIFSRLANQEGRVLLKLPPGMDRESRHHKQRTLAVRPTAFEPWQELQVARTMNDKHDI